MKHSDSDYITTDPFFGDESELTCRTIKIKTARKQHVCFSLDGKQDHFINPGDRYRYEKALIDRSFFGEYKICLACMDKLISEFDGNE